MIDFIRLWFIHVDLLGDRTGDSTTMFDSKARACVGALADGAAPKDYSCT